MQSNLPGWCRIWFRSARSIRPNHHGASRKDHSLQLHSLEGLYVIADRSKWIASRSERIEMCLNYVDGSP